MKKADALATANELLDEIGLAETRSFQAIIYGEVRGYIRALHDAGKINTAERDELRGRAREKYRLAEKTTFTKDEFLDLKGVVKI